MAAAVRTLKRALAEWLGKLLQAGPGVESRILTETADFNQACTQPREMLMTLRPHIPLIKFPVRGGPAPAASSPAANSVSAVSSPSGSPSSSSSSAAGSKPVGSTPRGSGIDDLDLPKKYQRKLISVDEMEYIERGGPA